MKRILAAFGVMAFGLSACSGKVPLETLAKVPGMEGLRTEVIALDPNTLPIIDQIGSDGRKAVNVVRINQKAAIDMIEVARNGDRSTYLSASRRGLVLKNGIITQTQGIGGDLSSSQHESYDLLHTNRVFTKTHGYLGGDDRIHKMTFRCIRTARSADYFGLREQRRLLVPVDEICRNEVQVHENIYFLYPGTDRVFRSRQWVSEQIGFLRVEQTQLPTP